MTGQVFGPKKSDYEMDISPLGCEYYTLGVFYEN